MQRILIYVITILFSVSIAGNSQDIERKLSPFAEGELRGLTLDERGFLSLFKIEDDFSSNTLEEYSVGTVFDYPENEFSVTSVNNRGGVFYSNKKKALFMEAGPEDKTVLTRRLPDLNEWIIHIRFKPARVFPDNGVTSIKLISSLKQKPAILTIPGSIQRRVTFSLPGTSEKPTRIDSEYVAGYSGINYLGGPKGTTADSHEIFNPKVLDITLIYSNGRLIIAVGANEVINTKPKKKLPLSKISLIFNSQEGYINLFEVFALKGTYISDIGHNALKKENVDLIAGISESKAFKTFLKCSIIVSSDKKDLINPDWTHASEFNKFPSDITAIYNSGEFLRYRLELRAKATSKLQQPLIQNHPITFPRIKWLHFQ